MLSIFKTESEEQPELVKKVISKKLTYLEPKALTDLFETVKRIEDEKIEGSILEMGCALGGSAIVIASAKDPKRPFFTYDVFSMIPPPSDKDGKDVQKRYADIKSGKSKGLGGDTYYGYQENLKQKVEDSFRVFGYPLKENNVHLVEGLYQNSLKLKSKDKIALAHIDCDWYDSVMVCLERIVPHIVKGGVLVIDDYYSWSGCKDAVDDYFRQRKSDFDFIKKSRLHIVKIN